jgi:hypothetical protein
MIITTGTVFAKACTVTVTAPDSIQDAIDSASAGNTVCVTGTFHQSVVFSSSASGVTLSGVGTAILDGSGSADSGTTLNTDYAILLQDGVSGVTIQKLEIREYAGHGGGGEGNAIQAWDVSTSNIKVRDNYMHDNGWNGVLVGSEGGYMHAGWLVQGNRAEDNGFAQIELTNCNHCSILDNTVADTEGWGNLGILVQARNTHADSGTIVVQSVSVKKNTITLSGPSYYDIGIYVYAQVSDTSYDPISGAYAYLRDVSITGNTISGDTIRYGVILWAFSGSGSGQAFIVNTAITSNVLTGPGSGTGVWVYNADVINTKIVKNTYSGWEYNFRDTGTDTKIPPPIEP